MYRRLLQRDKQFRSEFGDLHNAMASSTTCLRVRSTTTHKYKHIETNCLKSVQNETIRLTMVVLLLYMSGLRVIPEISDATGMGRAGTVTFDADE